MSSNNFKTIQLKKNSKIPMYKWKKTNNKKIIPGSNYGVLGGKINNIVVIDLDFHKFKSQNDNYDEFILLFTPDYINLFNTLTVKTANKGFHLYFKYDEQITTTTNKKYQIDIRSDGSYVVGSGSKLDFNKYETIKQTSIKIIPPILKQFLLNKILTKNPYSRQTKRITKTCIDNSSYKYDVTEFQLNEIINKLPKSYFNNYSEWIKFTTFMKIINYKNKWDLISSKYNNYNKIKNEYIWNNINIRFGIVQDILKLTNMSYLLPYIIYKNGIKKHITPNKIINKRKLGEDFIKPFFNDITTKVLIIKSDTGTGKTYSMHKYLSKNLNKPFISICSRVSLCQEQYNNFNSGMLSCLYYKDYYLFDEDNQDDNIIITIDSIMKLNLNFKNYTIYLDEIASIIEYIMMASTMNSKRVVIFSKLLNILNECEHIVCTDADINFLCFKLFDFLKLKYHYVVNKFKHNQDIKSEEITSEKTFIDMLKSENKYIVCCDSKISCQQLYKILDDKTIKLISSDTNEFINLDDYPRVLFTPKIIYGIDSSMVRSVYCYYKQNTISARSMVQQISRCRNITKLRYLFLNKRISNNKFNSFENCVNDTIFKNKISGIDYGLCVDSRINDLYTYIFSYLKYNNDCYQVNKFKHFKNLIIERGFNDDKLKNELTITTNKKDINKELKEDREKEFNIKSDEVKSINKYLRIPTDMIEKYRELFINPFKLIEHFNISNLLFKQNKHIYESIMNRCDFNINKINSTKNKILILKKICKKYNINYNESLIFDNVEFIKPEYNINNIFNYSKKITNKYDLQKFVNYQIKKIFGNKLYDKKRITRKHKNINYRLYNLTINPDIFKYHFNLYDYRNSM